MRARVLHPSDYRRMRWKNGGGWTTELLVFPDSGADANSPFDWRVSIAEIESDGAFSAFPGCDRHIALLDGVGMELRFEDAESARLDQRLQFVPFAGEAPVFGKLLSGPVRDFNVITRREKCRAQILHRPLVGPMLFVAEAVTWFVYLATGAATCRIGDAECELAAGASLVLDMQSGEPGNFALRGGGELVLARFDAVAT